MPLILLCGYPCSGKSKKADALKNFFEKENKKCTVITQDILNGNDLNDAYTDVNREKQSRSNLQSTVQRLLSKDMIVIVDAMNYIKGFRYQLYCIAREAQTTHCVLYCVASSKECKANNVQSGARWSDNLIDELIMRFEEPSNRTKWDSPLFTTSIEEQLDFIGIEGALFDGIVRAPSMSTATNAFASSKNTLIGILEKECQRIIDCILDHLKNHTPPTSIKFTNTNLYININQSKGALQRFKRQFIQMNKIHQIQSDNIEPLFIEFLAFHTK